MSTSFSQLLLALELVASETLTEHMNHCLLNGVTLQLHRHFHSPTHYYCEIIVWLLLEHHFGKCLVGWDSHLVVGICNSQLFFTLRCVCVCVPSNTRCDHTVLCHHWGVECVITSQREQQQSQCFSMLVVDLLKEHGETLHVTESCSQHTEAEVSVAKDLCGQKRQM